MADVQKLNVNNTTYDISTTWSKVTGKPSTFPPEAHTHSYLPLSGGTMSNQNVVVNLNADLLDGYSGSAYAKKTDLASYLPLSGGTMTGPIKLVKDSNKITTNIIDNNFQELTHQNSFGYISIGPFNDGYGHIYTDRPQFYFNKPLLVNGTAVSLNGHTHDDRYYTESEINTKLAGKSDTHSHPYLSTSGGTISSSGWNAQLHINRTSSSGSWGPAISFDYDGACNGTLTMSSNKLYVGDNGNTRTEVSMVGHTHDDRYYTESEINTKLSGKSDTGHTHSNYVTTDTAQTITGAKTFNNGDQSPITLTRSSSDMVSVKFVGSSGALGYLGFMGVDQPMLRRVSDNAYLNLLHSGNSSVSKSGETLTVTINGVSKSLTNTNTTYTSLKNPYSLSVFGVSYDGSSAKTLTGATFGEGTSNLTDGTMLLTSYASDNGFADTNAPGTVYKRKASCVWGYIQDKTDAKYSLIGHTHSGYATSSHTHDDRYYTESEINTKLNGKSDTGHTHNYLPLSGGTMSNQNVVVNLNADLLDGYSGSAYAKKTDLASYLPLSGGTLSGMLTIEKSSASSDAIYWVKTTNSNHYLGFGEGTSGNRGIYDQNLGWVFKIASNDVTTVYANGGFYQSSDERLKTFYDPIKVDLDKLKTLRKNYFKFNDKEDKLEIGVSAQEIQEIYPEIVSTDDNGYLSVAYDKLSVIALAAIDELDDKYQKEINDLKDQLKAIKNILNEKGII